MTNYNIIKRVLVEGTDRRNPMESRDIHEIACRVNRNLNIVHTRRILRNMARVGNSGVHRRGEIGKRGCFYLYWYESKI